MTFDELVAWAIFLGYFGVIFGSFGFVAASIVSERKAVDLLSGRPFVFARAALGGLLCTWYCEWLVYMKMIATNSSVMLQFMKVRWASPPPC